MNRVRFVVFGPLSVSKHETALTPFKSTRKISIDIIPATAFDDWDSSELFDLIIFNNNLHLFHEPDDILLKTSEQLREGGHMLITSPNISSPFVNIHNSIIVDQLKLKKKYIFSSDVAIGIYKYIYIIYIYNDPYFNFPF